MKHKFIIFSFLLILVSPIIFINNNNINFEVYADTTTEDEIEQELQDSIDEQLGGIDFGNIDEVLENLDDKSSSIFDGQNFFDKVTAILDGNLGNQYPTFFQAIINTVFSEIVNFIPLLATIVAVTVLCSLIGNLRGKESDESIGQIVQFVAFSIVVVAVAISVFGLLKDAQNLITSIKTQMEVIFPILLTLLASVGGAVSVGIFQPAVAILSSVVVQIFFAVVIPIFTFIFIFIIVGNFSNNVRLGKMTAFLQSVLKWVAGVCFSVFLSVLLIQGIVAGSFDSVSIKAMKFAIKSYVPILGGYLSDGFNMVMASSVLIKNAVGMAGVLLLFASVLVPVIKIAICILCLKLCAGILEPITESKVPDFLHQVAKTLNLLIMIILGISFMYIITVGLILCSINIL